jgi:hypothetical protein
MNFNETKPTTLEEAIKLIVDDLRPEDREYIAKEGTAGSHHSFGMALRNGWGLWHGSELAEHFKSTYGLGHADDMSGLIMAGVKAAVRGQVFDPQPEVDRYKEHWKRYGVNPLTQERV